MAGGKRKADSEQVLFVLPKRKADSGESIGDWERLLTETLHNLQRPDLGPEQLLRMQRKLNFIRERIESRLHAISDPINCC